MIVVRIIKGLEQSHLTSTLIKQTPNCSGQWDGIQFTPEPIANPDYLIIVNFVHANTIVECSPENVWAIIQEPPVPNYKWFAKGFRQFNRVYTPDISLKGDKYIHTQPAIRWFVNRDYDYLKSCQIPEKIRNLSWITSNKKLFQGHRTRIGFLEQIRQNLDFDLWGKGFRSIPDKWDGLAPYKYSLAIENYSGLNYWSEKLADCFLSYTMPIYYGCLNLSDYFPQESFIWIDINKPQEAIEIIEATIASNLWEKNLDAIIQARELILDKYQFFPFFAERIRESRSSLSSPVQIEFPKLNHIDWRYYVQHSELLISNIMKKMTSVKRN